MLEYEKRLARDSKKEVSQQNKERRKYVKKDSAIVKDRRHLEKEEEERKKEKLFFPSNFVDIFLTYVFLMPFLSRARKQNSERKRLRQVKITLKEQ